ncbi:MAG: hypothetical protein O7J95_05110, partial [Planctomycetota bacterium]|nr:hypothetical protein [Planctomycetota bacterium]
MSDRSRARRLAVLCAGATACFLCLLSSPRRVSGQETLVGPDEEWRFFRGVEDAPFDWLERGFDDSGWETGQAGFGYEAGNNPAAVAATNTTLDDMRNNYLSVFLRKTFMVADPSQFKALRLGAQYDDGFVAYLNGMEIARAGMTGNPPAFNDTAVLHEFNARVEWFNVSPEALRTVEAGANVFAIQAHNANLTSSDFQIVPQAQAFSSLCPTGVRCRVRTNGSVSLTWVHPFSPPPAYTRVEIVRDGQVIAEAEPPTRRTFSDRDPPPGEHVYEVIATVGDERCSGDGVPTCTVMIESDDPMFRRADADVNGQVNITDAVFILNGLFLGGDQPVCPDSADTDDNGRVILTDAIFLLNHLFLGGPEPPPPGRSNCGLDDAMDQLG